MTAKPPSGPGISGQPARAGAGLWPAIPRQQMGRLSARARFLFRVDEEIRRRTRLRLARSPASATASSPVAMISSLLEDISQESLAEEKDPTAYKLRYRCPRK